MRTNTNWVSVPADTVRIGDIIDASPYMADSFEPRLVWVQNITPHSDIYGSVTLSFNGEYDVNRARNVYILTGIER